jgi:hypothetical protein
MGEKEVEMLATAGVFVAVEQDRPLPLQREECFLDTVVK